MQLQRVTLMSPRYYRLVPIYCSIAFFLISLALPAFTERGNVFFNDDPAHGIRGWFALAFGPIAVIFSASLSAFAWGGNVCYLWALALAGMNREKSACAVSTAGAILGASFFITARITPLSIPFTGHPEYIGAPIPCSGFFVWMIAFAALSASPLVKKIASK